MANNKIAARSVWIGTGLLLSAVAIGLVIAPMFPVPCNFAVAAAPGPTFPEGMTPEVIKAVDLGLRRLAECQRPNGCWMSGGSYGGAYPVVMTSLAGMAFLSSGSTPESGTYSKNVRKAMDYILSIAEKYGSKDGLIGGEGSEGRSMYGHGFGMLFLAECYGVESTPEYQERIKKVLDRGVALTAKAQSKKNGSSPGGGWYYGPEDNSDEGSVTVTQLQALRAARNAGIKVPAEVIKRSVAYLKYCQNPDGGISYSANSRGSSRPPISAAAIACFYAAGVYDRQTSDGKPSEEATMVAKLIKYCKAHASPKNNDSYWFYAQYYMSSAMYQAGGKEWQEHYKAIKEHLLNAQSPDGYWNGDGIGNVYGTAMACIMLQLPYGYLPIFEK